MSSRSLTGLLLIVGPMLLVASMIAWGVIIGNINWADASAFITAMGENAGLVKVAIPVYTLGMLMVAAGFAGLNHSMSGGSSAHYMKVGLLFYIIGTTVVVGESALNISLAEAASNGNQATAEALLAASWGFGSAGEAIRFLGFALIGVSIFTQKNLHVALGALMVIIGLFGVGVSVCDYTSPIMAIPFLGVIILTIATGIQVNRTKD